MLSEHEPIRVSAAVHPSDCGESPLNESTTSLLDVLLANLIREMFSDRCPPSVRFPMKHRLNWTFSAHLPSSRFQPDKSREKSHTDTTEHCLLLNYIILTGGGYVSPEEPFPVFSHLDYFLIWRSQVSLTRTLPDISLPFSSDIIRHSRVSFSHWTLRLRQPDFLGLGQLMGSSILLLHILYGSSNYNSQNYHHSRFHPDPLCTLNINLFPFPKNCRYPVFLTVFNPYLRSTPTSDNGWFSSSSPASLF